MIYGVPYSPAWYSHNIISDQETHIMAKKIKRLKLMEFTGLTKTLELQERPGRLVVSKVVYLPDNSFMMVAGIKFPESQDIILQKAAYVLTQYPVSGAISPQV